VLGIALIAALVITIVGAAAPTATAAGDPNASPSLEPGTSATARLLPDPLPADLPGGTIDTPLGTARWVHLSGDQEALPPLQSMAAPDGLVWFDMGQLADESRGGWECAPRRPRLWTSADVTSTRTEHPLPVEAGYALLTFDGDRYWLIDMASGSLWRSSDLTDWERMDGSALHAPDPAELPWNVRFGVPVTSAGVTLVPVSHEVLDPGRVLGFPGRSVHLEAAGPGRYDVIESHMRKDDQKVATVLVERTPSGIRLSDESGATIAELTGVGPEFVEAWASSGGIESVDQLALVDGSRPTPVTKPGQAAMDSWSSGLELLPLDPGFLAFELDADSTVRTWRSADGVSWIEGDPVPGPDGQPLRAQALWGGTRDERHEVSVSPLLDDPDGTARPPEWRSVDGKTWTAYPDPPAGEYSVPPVRLPAGYVAWSDYGMWSVSTDGSSWQEVPGLREVIPRTTLSGEGSVSWGGIGNALLFAMTAECGQRDLWIVEFDQETG
jgi:hypothetical protein